MPAADITRGLRSTKLLQILFWAGVGLTPLAALLLLIGDGFVLQVAAVLAVLVVLLIGLSIALRRENVSVRGEVEEILYEEMDTLREEIRGDITHAARQTHGQLVERIGVLHETVDALRNQVDMMRGQLERAASQQLPPSPHHTGSAAVPQGVLRTETVQVTTKTMVVDPTDQRRDGTVYGARPELPQQRRPERGERGDWPEQPGADWGHRQDRGPDRQGHGDRPGRPDRGGHGEWNEAERGPRGEWSEHAERGARGERGGRGEWSEHAERSARGERGEERGGRGDERGGRGDWNEHAERGGRSDERGGHGEWSDQSDRSDRAERGGRAARGEWAEHGDRSERSSHADRSERSERGAGPGRGEQGQRSERISRSERTERSEWTERSERSEWIERAETPREETWTERLLRERMERSGGDSPPAAARDGGGRRRAYDPEDEGNITGVRTTDRWASVHSDERGSRELRMGERRAAVHADETGTHVRIEDRWATVRHEEFYPGDAHSGGLPADDEPRQESPRRSAARRERERDWASGEIGLGDQTGRHGTDPDLGTDWAERTAREFGGGGPDSGHRARDEGRASAHWSESSYEEARRDDNGGTRWSEVRRERHAPGAQAALPASPAEPASRWTSGSAGPAREEERVSRRARQSDDEEEYGWNGARDEQRGRAARPIVDFEGSDDRWR